MSPAFKLVNLSEDQHIYLYIYYLSKLHKPSTEDETDAIPIALVRLRLPLTRPAWINPPANRILRFSSSSSGLWSTDRSTACWNPTQTAIYSLMISTMGSFRKRLLRKHNHLPLKISEVKQCPFSWSRQFMQAHLWSIWPQELYSDHIQTLKWALEQDQMKNPP